MQDKYIFKYVNCFELQVLVCIISIHEHPVNEPLFTLGLEAITDEGICLQQT